MGQQNSNTENYREDEIDLRKLFQAIGNGFVSIGRAFINLIIRIRRVSIKYKVFIILMGVLGFGVGTSFYKIFKPYYSTSMLLSSEYFNNRFIESNIKKLDALCKEKDRKELASVLNVDYAIASNIKSFESNPIIPEQELVEIEILKRKLEGLEMKGLDINNILKQIEVQNNKTYAITVHVFDNTIIGNLEKSIVNFFKNEPFIKNRIEATKKGQILLAEKLKNDIVQLDSLKQLFNLNLKANAGRKGESASLYVGESGLLDPVSFYSQSVNLYEKLKKIEREIMLSNDFELINGFTSFSKPTSLGTLKSALVSILYFIGLAYFIIIFIETNKCLNQIEKERFNKLEG